MIETQLGGKFSREDLGLFIFKKKLQAAGIKVRFPEGDSIIGEYKGIGVTFDPNSGKTFYDVEVEYMRSIQANPIHVVYNKYGSQLGYIGESASVEVAYAMLCNKPVVILYPPLLSANIPSMIKPILEKNVTNFNVQRLDALPDPDIYTYIESKIKAGATYLLNNDDKQNIQVSITALLESYKSRS